MRLMDHSIRRIIKDAQTLDEALAEIQALPGVMDVLVRTWAQPFGLRIVEIFPSDDLPSYYVEVTVTSH